MSPPSSQGDSSPTSPLVRVTKSLVLLLFAAAVGFLAAKKLNFGWVPGGVIGASIFGVGGFAMMKLRGSPREMGLTFGLKFLSVTAYKILNVTLVLWLCKDLGYTERGALNLIVGWSFFMTVTTILAGSITDALGLRRTLLIGMTLCVLTRLVMVFSTNGVLSLVCGLFPLAIGEALCTPVLVAAFGGVLVILRADEFRFHVRLLHLRRGARNHARPWSAGPALGAGRIESVPDASVGKYGDRIVNVAAHSTAAPRRGNDKRGARHCGGGTPIPGRGFLGKNLSHHP
jgi:hypothetical protein